MFGLIEDGTVAFTELGCVIWLKPATLRKCSGKSFRRGFWPQNLSMGTSNSSPRLVQVSLTTRKLRCVIWPNPGTLRKCSGKVIPQRFWTPKVIHGHFKFIPQTSPGVITNPQIKVCHLTKPSHSQEMLWKSHSAGFSYPKSDPWALQIHLPDRLVTRLAKALIAKLVTRLARSEPGWSRSGPRVWQYYYLFCHHLIWLRCQWSEFQWENLPPKCEILSYFLWCILY